MNIRKYIVTALILLFLIPACSKKEILKDKKGNIETNEDISASVDADVEDIYAWVNLMPGPDFKPKFHITGKLIIDESDLYDFKSIRMIQINIYQGGKRIFEITPRVQQNDEEDSEESKYLLFSTVEGIVYKDEIVPEERIDVKLLFVDNGKIYSYMIYDVKVEKAV